MIHTQILIIMLFTFVIHLIGTWAYGVRIVAMRTRRIAISWSLWGIMQFVGRGITAFQAPLIAKYIEQHLGNLDVVVHLRLILLSATLATLAAALMLPTIVRLFSAVVNAFHVYRSVPRLFVRSISKIRFRYLRTFVAIPKPIALINSVRIIGRLPLQIVFFNTCAESLWAVGILASVYAGYLNPTLRATTSYLSAAVTSSAAAMMCIFIDPYLSALLEDVIQGAQSVKFFYSCIIILIGGRLVGTLLAQVILIPGAWLISEVAMML